MIRAGESTIILFYMHSMLWRVYQSPFFILISNIGSLHHASYITIQKVDGTMFHY